jgi:hypothetical protein
MESVVSTGIAEPINGDDVDETVEERDRRRVDDMIHLAKTELAGFQEFVTVEYRRASSFYETAKNMFAEVETLWARGKRLTAVTAALVQKKDSDSWEAACEQLTYDLTTLVQHQQESWDKLLQSAREQECATQEAYEKVRAVEAQLLLEQHRSGEPGNVFFSTSKVVPTLGAWLGLFSTHEPKQMVLRRVYSQELRPSFANAKRAMDSLVGSYHHRSPEGILHKVPEGLWLKIPWLYRRSCEGTANLSKKLRRRTSAAAYLGTGVMINH